MPAQKTQPLPTPTPENTLLPELARNVPALVKAGITVMVVPARDPMRRTHLTCVRDAHVANVQMDPTPLATRFTVTMPIAPSLEHGSAVLLSEKDPQFDEDQAVESANLLAAVEQALVPQAHSPVTGRTHANAGTAAGWTIRDRVRLAGPEL